MSPSFASCAREARIVLFLLLVKAEIFQEPRSGRAEAVAIVASAFGPMHSSPNNTVVPCIIEASLFATGRSEYFGSGLPLGRPKWERMTTFAPRLVRSRTVGMNPLDPRRVGDLGSGHRNVEVGAD